MARYRGPRLKVARALGVNVIFHSRLEGERSRLMTPPGEHGKKRKKLSDYAVRLKEKQKLRAYYGLLEKQFRKYVEKAFKQKGVTGDNLVIALETRLDNLVFRLGFGSSLRQSRQMVNHGHFLVNGKKVDIPSYACKPGDIIALKEKSKKTEMFVENFTVNSNFKLDYLERDTDKLVGKLAAWPTRDAIPVEIQDSFIVEFYARMM
jgi:small subunit ribosomal protein S4